MRIKIMQKIIDIINKWVTNKNERGFCINYLEAEISKTKARRFKVTERRTK
jgi:hypothetical protein